MPTLSVISQGMDVSNKERNEKIKIYRKPKLNDFSVELSSAGANE